MKRGAIRSVSARRAAQADHRNKVRFEVFHRDDWRCQLRDGSAGQCFGPLTVHHLRKASQGGKYEASNLVTLCARHNDWVEDEPAKAYAMGLVIRGRYQGDADE